MKWEEWRVYERLTSGVRARYVGQGWMGAVEQRWAGIGVYFLGAVADVLFLVLG